VAKSAAKNIALSCGDESVHGRVYWHRTSRTDRNVGTNWHWQTHASAPLQVQRSLDLLALAQDGQAYLLPWFDCLQGAQKFGHGAYLSARDGENHIANLKSAVAA
jgi:hypothetical protein